VTPEDALPPVDAPGAAPARRRGVVVAALAAAVLLGVVVIAAVVIGGDGGDGADEARPTFDRSTLPAPTGPAVTILAGTPIQPVVDAHPAGTRFVLGEGVHRAQRITPRPGDVFEGVGPATVLDGSIDLADWSDDGGSWSTGGLPAPAAPHGRCRHDAPRCDKAEELFRNGRRLRAVAALADLEPGTWYFDDDTGTAHVADDPTGAEMSLSVVPFAVEGDADGVVVRDLTVTRYASPAQRGAITAGGVGWVIERVTANDNHGLGVYFSGDGTLVRDLVARGNGQMGMGGSGATGAVVERVELTDNNQAGFDDEWEGGGAKFTGTTGLRFADSTARGNDGAGIWFDEDAQDSLIEGNTSADNSGAGIFYEISRGGTITGNVVTGNGHGESPRGWLWGAGILVAGSWDVTVVDNEVAGNLNGITVIQQDRGSGRLGERLVDDVVVRGNTVEIGAGTVGVSTDVRGSDLFDRSITFDDNTYLDTGPRSFEWDGERLDLQGWNDLGFS